MFPNCMGRGKNPYFHKKSDFTFKIEVFYFLVQWGDIMKNWWHFFSKIGYREDELQFYFDIQSFSRVLPLLILPHFLVIFSLILCSKNLKIAITKNGFDEKIFLAWIHLYYSKVFPKSEVPTLFYFVRVQMVLQSHVS